MPSKDIWQDFELVRGVVSKRFPDALITGTITGNPDELITAIARRGTLFSQEERIVSKQELEIHIDDVIIAKTHTSMYLLVKRAIFLRHCPNKYETLLTRWT